MSATKPIKTNASANTMRIIRYQFLMLLLLLFFHYIEYAHCTSTQSLKRGGAKEPINEGRGITSDTGSNTISRQPKILKELTLLNKQSCLSKILCGVEVARKPSTSTSTLNDYAYLVKSFFDRFSLLGNKDKKTAEEQDETDSDENDDDEEQSGTGYSGRKNSKQPAYDHDGMLSGYEDKELEDSFNKPLESLVEEESWFPFSFKKRRSRRSAPSHKEGNQTPLIFKVSDMNLNHTDKSSTIRPLQRGFMNFYNPRFDKTAFLNSRQDLLNRATTEEAKLKISAEVAAKLRSPRKCRQLTWLNNNVKAIPQYTTTTTITTITNNPNIVGTAGAVGTAGTAGAVGIAGALGALGATDSNFGETAAKFLCPFTVEELQKMILGQPVGSSETVQSPQTRTKAQPPAILSAPFSAAPTASPGIHSHNGLTIEKLMELQNMHIATTPPPTAKIHKPTLSYMTSRPATIRTTIIPPPAPTPSQLTRDDWPYQPYAPQLPPVSSRPPPQVFATQRPQVIPHLKGSSSYYRPEDDEQKDVLGNPYGDIVPARYQYKPHTPGSAVAEKLNYVTLPSVGKPPPTPRPWDEMNVQDEIPEHLLSQPARKAQKKNKIPKKSPNRSGISGDASEEKSEESSEEKSRENKDEETSDKSEEKSDENKEEETSDISEETNSKENEDDGKSDEEDSDEHEEKKTHKQSNLRRSDEKKMRKQSIPRRPSKPLLFNMAGEREELPEEDSFDDEEHSKPKEPMLPYKYARESGEMSSLGVEAAPSQNEVYRPQVEQPPRKKPHEMEKDDEDDSEEERNPTKDETADDDSDEDESKEKKKNVSPSSAKNKRHEDESGEHKDDSNEEETNKEESAEDKKETPEDSDEQDEQRRPSQPSKKVNEPTESEENNDPAVPPKTAGESEEDDVPPTPPKEKEEPDESNEETENEQNDESKEEIEDPTDLNEESDETSNELRKKRGSQRPPRPPPPPPPPPSERGIFSFLRGSSSSSSSSSASSETNEHVEQEKKPKTSSKKKTSPPKPSSSPESKPAENSDRGGLLSSILSNHGKHTFNRIQTMFGYGTSDTDMLPPPLNKPPKPHRRRPPPRRRKKKPHHDEQSHDDEDSEEDDEPKKKKTTTTTTPRPTAPPNRYAVPLHYPFYSYSAPQITPLVIEDDRNWEGKEKPHDNEEFFEPKEKTTEKPEKYDYDDEEEDDTSASSEDDSKEKKKDTGDRFVSGLPMSWEEYYADMLKQKVAEKVAKMKIKPESAVKEEEAQNDESDESEEQADYGPPHPPRRPGSESEYNHRPGPAGVPDRGQVSHHHVMEPID